MMVEIHVQVIKYREYIIQVKYIFNDFLPH